MLPDESNNDINKKTLPEEHLPPEEGAGGEVSPDKTNAPKRRRMRVKIRKKIRIKQKPSAKKLVKKIAERTFWVVIIAGFIISLIIMIVELDVRDEKFKQQQKKVTRVKGVQ